MSLRKIYFLYLYTYITDKKLFVHIHFYSLYNNNYNIYHSVLGVWLLILVGYIITPLVKLKYFYEILFNM